MKPLVLNDFADAVGAAFLIASGDDTVELTLECADALPVWAPAVETFRLEFRGPFEPILPQAIYTFRREGSEARSFDIFIVPVGREEAGTLYEAIFTRV